MKLLFDENVSHRLVGALATTYPGSAHLRNIGLLGANDSTVWDHAREHGFVIVSKDNGFRQRSFVQGAPPKIIWLEVGNAGTDAILKLIQDNEARIMAFDRDVEASLLMLNRT
ncbi:MAG TPA: DUF5615 family PIN-like protein [Polyangiaceae bacterium]